MCPVAGETSRDASRPVSVVALLLEVLDVRWDDYRRCRQYGNRIVLLSSTLNETLTRRCPHITRFIFAQDDGYILMNILGKSQSTFWLEALNTTALSPFSLLPREQLFTRTPTYML